MLDFDRRRGLQSCVVGTTRGSIGDLSMVRELARGGRNGVHHARVHVRLGVERLFGEEENLSGRSRDVCVLTRRRWMFAWTRGRLEEK